MTESIIVRPPIDRSDRDWLAQLWRSEWDGETMVSRETHHHLDDLDALIAWEGGVRIGAATFRLDGSGCELMSINAQPAGRGIGSRLLDAVEQAARRAGCTRIWLITTNDNLEALRFYQRRGYRLVALHRDAVDRARIQKPTISLVGNHDIPIHDEIELAKEFAREERDFGSS